MKMASGNVTQTGLDEKCIFKLPVVGSKPTVHASLKSEWERTRTVFVIIWIPGSETLTI